jgi:hypothetical protein
LVSPGDVRGVRCLPAGVARLFTAATVRGCAGFGAVADRLEPRLRGSEPVALLTGEPTADTEVDTAVHGERVVEAGLADRAGVAGGFREAGGPVVAAFGEEQIRVDAPAGGTITPVVDVGARVLVTESHDASRRVSASSRACSQSAREAAEGWASPVPAHVLHMPVHWQSSHPNLVSPAFVQW